MLKFSLFRSFLSRSYSTKKHFLPVINNNLAKDQIVVSDDGSTVICWHPEQGFPYEYSLPLPEQPQAPYSVLKVQTIEALKAIRRPKNEEIARQELMALTHTTKHRWYPKSRIHKRKNTPMDRPYL